jgi:hypothetical protein
VNLAQHFERAQLPDNDPSGSGDMGHKCRCTRPVLDFHDRTTAPALPNLWISRRACECLPRGPTDWPVAPQASSKSKHTTKQRHVRTFTGQPTVKLGGAQSPPALYMTEADRSTQLVAALICATQTSETVFTAPTHFSGLTLRTSCMQVAHP